MIKNDPTPPPSLWQKTTINKLISVMRQTHGIDISFCEVSFLAKSIEKRRQAIAAETPTAYLERLSEDCAEAEAFFRSLRISYSEFFRNPLAFALLEQIILPGMIEESTRIGRGELRVWSAGCAAGQEAWSVAILLQELAACRECPPAFRIFATDVSEPDIALGISGVYRADAVGNVRWRHLRSYFSGQGDCFTIIPQLRNRVDFCIHDLLDERTTCPPASIYGHFDLVLCCNVLLYYRPEMQRLILEKLKSCLSTGGYLITGETERQIAENAGGFHAVAPPASVFQKVREKKGG